MNPSPVTAKLTQRHYEILSLATQGLVYKEIGERLGISKDTVKNHITEMFHRLDVHDLTHAVYLVFCSQNAFENGVIAAAQYSNAAHEVLQRCAQDANEREWALPLLQTFEAQKRRPNGRKPKG